VNRVVFICPYAGIDDREGPTEKGKRISDIAARGNRQWNRHCEGLGYGVDVWIY